MTAVQIITLRPAAFAGGGDVLRAKAIVDAIRSAGHEASVLSILDSDESIMRAFANVAALRSLFKILIRHAATRPIQWILVQALASARSMRLDGAGALPLYLTSRVVPDRLPPAYAVDFVDALSRNAESRAEHASLLKPFWRREKRLLEVWERSIAVSAAVSTAVSDVDARHIYSAVLAVPIQTPQRPTAISLRISCATPRLVFSGNLYYPPNREAAQWILTMLLPELVRRSWSPDQVIIAGRRPGKSLHRLAAEAGATLLSDVPDMEAVLRSATIALAPMDMGSGVQTKVVDALRLGVAVVMTLKANEGLALSNSAVVRVVDRHPGRFADAIESILVNQKGTDQQPKDVARILASSEPEAVSCRWLEVLQPILVGR